VHLQLGDGFMALFGFLSRPGDMADLVEYGFLAAAGVYFTLAGYRVIGTTPGTNERVDAFHQKWGRLARIGGPVMIVCGLWLIAAVLLKKTSS
jgi:hypothetical protein